MTIFHKGSFVTFASDPRLAVQSLALAVISAIQQSYPERLTQS